MQKTLGLMAVLSERMQERQAIFDPALFSTAPKISRGEQYRGLPYVVLDYPRLYHGDSLLFVRTMFWWGHTFSSTLQLAGRYRNQYLGRLEGAYALLRDYYIGIQEDPWQHHFGEENYRLIGPMKEAAYKKQLEEQAHIKIAAQYPLEEWNDAADALLARWQFLLSLIA